MEINPNFTYLLWSATTEDNVYNKIEFLSTV
jgi:hypothetical protein